MKQIVHTGDCRALIARMPAETFDAIVTDPPYGLSFMGKGWDRAVPGPEYWTAALRVAKPGAHLLAFGGTRVWHRLACAIEDAGWELRDTVMWLHGQGFPKSHDVSKAIDREAGTERPRERCARNNGLGAAFADDSYGGGDGTRIVDAPATPAAAQWSGWGTALKPAWEPVIVARKPLIGTVAENVQRYGTGGINVDGCRIGTGEDIRGTTAGTRRSGGIMGASSPLGGWTPTPGLGRWPANLVLDEEAASALDEQSGALGTCGTPKRTDSGAASMFGGGAPGAVYGDSGGASRFFYVAKARKAERNLGGVDNKHPTVKPLALMRWLVRLVTPPGGIVLDPFAGSGTTGIAAAMEGFRFVGCEMDETHAEVARKRIAAAA